MSFSTQVKEELNSIQIKGNCCKKAYLLGAVLSAESTDGVIRLTVSDPQTAEKIILLLGTIYKCSAEVKTLKRGCFESMELCFECKKIFEFLRLVDASFDGADDDFLKCPNCRSAFLRGVFCSSGSVSDPKHSYSLEIRTKTRGRAELIQSIIGTWDIAPPRLTQRENAIGLFYRSESAIEDMLTACGANRAIFAMNDIWVEKDFRNSENRATNCVARNISKSVRAASLQISAIEALISSRCFEDMPDELKITAKLRASNPDINLAELSELHEPPISRSGVSHRLTRIVEEAKKRKLI